MKNASIVDVLIENITTDQNLLKHADQKIELAKEEKREITDRLKDYRRDASTLMKYASQEQQKKIEELGFEFHDSERGMNPVASLVLDIIMKAKEHKMTNGELHQAYVKTFEKAENAYSYTEFNIKCRSLFNTQRLLRSKGSDPKNTRLDVISLNGQVVVKPLNEKTVKTSVAPVMKEIKPKIDDPKTQKTPQDVKK